MAGARELCDLRMVAKDGSDLWTMVSFGPILDQQGQSVGVLGMVVDVTARKKAETQVRLAAQVFDTAAKGIMILDADKNVVEVNRAFTQATGFEAQEVVGKKPWFLGGSLQDEAFYQGIWQALRKTGNWRGEIDNRRKNGEVIPALLNVSAVRDEHGEITHYAAIFSDIADLKAAQRQLEYLATYDTLTGLPNRNLFYDRLQHGVEKASRDGKRLALFFVDLDNFKTINDTLGHEMGDRLLAQVADRLSACTRREDTVARLGGDEFAIITEDVAHPGAEAAITARHMIAALSAPFKLDNQEVFVSASIGIALFPDNGRDAAALLRNADTAMYKAKDLGKNSYHFFTEELDMRAAERAATENGLRHALKHDEFFLFYQPQMELDSGCIVGFEALLRWQHPDFGLLLPEHFIPVAETSGLIVPIGKWVMRTACRQIRDWSRQGLGDFRIAVNLSARQFRQKKFAEAIREIIEEMEIEPSNLEVELTESTLMDDAEHAGRVLRQLKEMGVHIAIDDFGTGYSSLQYLKKFPIDHLKIDSHFVNDIATNRDDAAIAMAIITMGHSMQMKVVAEGVETSEQLAFLRASGCDVIQGYIVNMPLSVGNAATALRENAHCHRLSS
jgi:diguanylate cyclase (GGDEF)-like protein/PAS domain S-box-containing protein